MARANGRPIELYGEEKALFELLKKRYPAPAWACIPQVANGTGAHVRRWADAIALCCYPSMGLELHGFEIKTHRSDWLRELQNGEKSQAVWQFCDRWWIVVADKAIVAPGELPKTWGLLAPKGGRLYTETPAPALKPRAPTKTFVASVLRNAMGVCVPDAFIANEFKRGRDDGLKEGADRAKYDLDEIKKKLSATEAAIQSFEKTSGLKFPNVCAWMGSHSDHEAFGAAVRQVLAGQDGALLNRLLSVRDKARALADEVDKKLAEASEPVASGGGQ